MNKTKPTDDKQHFLPHKESSPHPNRDPPQHRPPVEEPAGQAPVPDVLRVPVAPRQPAHVLAQLVDVDEAAAAEGLDLFPHGEVRQRLDAPRELVVVDDLRQGVHDADFGGAGLRGRGVRLDRGGYVDDRHHGELGLVDAQLVQVQRRVAVGVRAGVEEDAVAGEQAVGKLLEDSGGGALDRGRDTLRGLVVRHRHIHQRAKQRVILWEVQEDGVIDVGSIEGGSAEYVLLDAQIAQAVHALEAEVHQAAGILEAADRTTKHDILALGLQLLGEVGAGAAGKGLGGHAVALHRLAAVQAGHRRRVGQRLHVRGLGGGSKRQLLHGRGLRARIAAVAIAEDVLGLDHGPVAHRRRGAVTGRRRLGVRRRPCDRLACMHGLDRRRIVQQLGLRRQACGQQVLAIDDSVQVVHAHPGVAAQRLEQHAVVVEQRGHDASEVGRVLAEAPRVLDADLLVGGGGVLQPAQVVLLALAECDLRAAVLLLAPLLALGGVGRGGLAAGGALAALRLAVRHRATPPNSARPLGGRMSRPMSRPGVSARRGKEFRETLGGLR
ncbi:hypothetical protein DFJ74DRAFT_530529, partial [Hyaloraphidium curvatum]